MESTRQFSVIIPTRNEAAIIGETLRQYTALMDVVDLEIIVSDAHSTDDTAAIVGLITDLLRDDSARLQQIERGRRRAEEFRWQRTGQRIAEALEIVN